MDMVQNLTMSANITSISCTHAQETDHFNTDGSIDDERVNIGNKLTTSVKRWRHVAGVYQ